MDLPPYQPKGTVPRERVNGMVVVRSGPHGNRFPAELGFLQKSPFPARLTV